ncbi:MAG: hypothetical protein IIV90_06320 [Oscillospiraceae bacterium]|nr:hypothetical protein [Oscillospiraceae bacterium]
MLGVLLLALCPLAGCCLLRWCFPSLQSGPGRSLSGKPLRLFLPFLTLPAGFCLGVLVLGWAAYLSAYLARGTAAPMTVGAGAALFLGAELARTELAHRAKSRPGSGKWVWRKGGQPRRPRTGKALRPVAFGGPELFALVFAALAGGFVTFYTFWEDAAAINMAVNVYSDFSPHIAVIRSFSLGDNFPTQYPHFADGTIRYHFMFVFFAGLLEYLGLPITLAFNLPSFFAFASLVLLLFTLAHAVTGSRGAAALSLVLFFFRSGWAFFTYLAARPGDVSLWAWLMENKTFIGTTANEDWGLFNQNVWANQRHLALGMCFVLIAVLVYLPLFRKGVERLAARAKEAGPAAGLKAFLFEKTAWLPRAELLWGLPAGLMLGAAAFWHGSMVISALLILAGMGLFSRGRLTYLFTALPAVALSTLQSRFFTGGGNPLELQFRLGFLAKSGSAGDILEYLLLLCGVFFPLFLLGLGWLAAKGRWAAGAFFLCTMLPLVQAFTLQMTIDIPVAHKQVMLSLILGGILPAWVLAALWGRVKAGRFLAPRRFAAAVLLVLLTVTGLEDAVTYSNLCRSGPICIFKESELTDWIRENTPKGSVFVTSYISIHPVFTAGRLTMQGWPYYAWSAGYDTYGRDDTLRALFAQRDAVGFARAALETGADYILVDDEMMRDERFAAFFEEGGEALIQQAFPLLWTDGFTRLYQIC